MSDLTTIRTTCETCGDVDLDAADILLIPGDPTVYRFSHCGAVTERTANLRTEVVLRTVGVRTVPSRCSCGLSMFTVGRVYLCRNCDAPMPGLPPADRRGFRG